MHLYTLCRFCESELKKPDTMRKAFCDGYCRSLKSKYGNIKNMNMGKEIDKTPNRKTPRKQSTKQPKAAKAAKTLPLDANGQVTKKKPVQRLTVVSVGLDYGKEITQAVMILEYDLFSPPYSNREGNNQGGEENVQD